MTGTIGAMTPAPSKVSPQEDIQALVDRLRQVPMSLRRFTVTRTVAAGMYRVDPQLQEQLLQAGLAHAGSGTDLLLDGYDIGNAALHLGRMSVQRRAMRTWASALRVGTLNPRARSIELVSTCPVPGHRGPCRFDVLQPDGTRRRVESGTQGETVLGSVTLPVPDPAPPLPERVVNLLRELDGVDFFLLPEVIRWDHDLMWSTGMGDCGVVADWLVAEAARRGLPARFSFGLLTSPPYSTPHCWAEFRVGPEWVAVDPMLMRAMARWGGLDATAFPAAGSLRPVVHRLGGRFAKVSSHQGVWAQLSARTRWLEQEEEAG